MRDKKGMYFFFLWFGAAVSVAEIMAGAFLGPLGMKKGLAVIIIGHLIGCLILGLAGIIGQEKDMTAMETLSLSFGVYGKYIFSVLNFIQLVGWTSIMLITASNGINQIFKSLFGYENFYLWVLIIAAIVYLWAEYSSFRYPKLNYISVVLLIILSLTMFYILINSKSNNVLSNEHISFGSGLELSIVMPISWLPLISDYTKHSENKISSFLGSFFGYFIASSFMYILGLLCAIKFNEIDIVNILVKGNFGIGALLIVVLSTVTTTFLDVYSAATTIFNIKRLNKKYVTLLIVGISIIFALFFKMEQYENFLYLIGAVFSPLFAVVLSDYFLLKNVNGKVDYFISFISFIIGFGFYILIKENGTFFGVTIPVMLLTALVSLMLKKLGGVIYGNVKQSM
ncbi:putative hydroxymethylpyrimidine transporter CytX [Thermobrachium celere]|uniref:Predicted hydroxymethylpyrimidine transporter CytX n=1 Tax=Thermobrachium celere DSM 8682 TaxID=941824 RepID=R7RMZ3_9CLOT|nr:putative hydroxymethylpyrimidine transporter CytX [Thermobrachium celere]CDF57419.1 Predicted hydroxymethylpyrimidine transporter CytX [Thermobrachium celere DSM 8682]